MLMNKNEISEGARAKGGSSEEFNTGSWRAIRPVIDTTKCINCMLCFLYCPDNSIIINKNGKDNNPIVIGVDTKHCKGCALCAQVCPIKCIKMVSEEEAKASERK